MGSTTKAFRHLLPRRWAQVAQHLGDYSTAMGFSTKLPHGNTSTAMGLRDRCLRRLFHGDGFKVAQHQPQFPLLLGGSTSVIHGDGYGVSFSFHSDGKKHYGSGNYSTAMGSGYTASGYTSTAMGSICTACFRPLFHGDGFKYNCLGYLIPRRWVCILVADRRLFHGDRKWCLCWEEIYNLLLELMVQ